MEQLKIRPPTWLLDVRGVGVPGFLGCWTLLRIDRISLHLSFI